MKQLITLPTTVNRPLNLPRLIALRRNRSPDNATCLFPFPSNCNKLIVYFYYENINAPQKEDNAPQKVDNASQKVDNAPQKEDNTPQKEDNAPQKEDNAPQKEDNAPQKTSIDRSLLSDQMCSFWTRENCLNVRVNDN
ncbi:unnamed protein product [Toxocara canis]|uniref:Uncharacterized protein n=1 Tax=Toxocara canis TaxID=6265 RepID=A0A183VDV8_TOXCA|nr:unnamed protein product [Toxocara canis]